MPGRQWVAFDVHTNSIHDHKKKAPVEKVKKKTTTTKKTTKVKNRSGRVTQDPYSVVDRHGEEFKLAQTKGKWLDLTAANKLKIFHWIISQNFSVKIEYQDESGDQTTRSIVPRQVLKGSLVKSAKIEAWCKLRNDSRVFFLNRVGQLFVEGLEKKKLPTLSKVDAPKMPTSKSAKDLLASNSSTASGSVENWNSKDNESAGSIFPTIIWVCIVIFILANIFD